MQELVRTEPVRLPTDILPEHAERLRRIEWLADMLDTRYRIPGLGWRFGGDTIIGLIPGIGDTLTAGLGAYLIVEARQAGASTGTIARMVGNTAIDWALGLVPLVGDLLDLGYKSNAKNARLLAEDIRRRHGATPAPVTATTDAAAGRGSGPAKAAADSAATDTRPKPGSTARTP